MTDYYGVNGTKIKAVKGFPDLPYGVAGGNLQKLFADQIVVASALASADRIWLGAIRSDAVLDGDLSKITFDDMGTTITIDVGCDDTEAAVSPYISGSSTKLVSALDVATAAGSSSLIANIATAKKNLPLWQQLGLTQDPRCQINLYATFSGDPGTGNIAWKWVGS